MRHLILLLLCMTSVCALRAQTLSLFDVDASAFPIMKAKFLALDTGGVQQRPGITELSLTENGSARTITNVSCPPASPPKALSAVLVIDVSGSMGGRSRDGSRIDLARAAATAWVKALPLRASECAITSFDGTSHLNQDFTTDRLRLLQSIAALQPQGGTDYDAALITPMAGGLQVSQRGVHQKMIILVTDGQSHDPNTTAIVENAKRQKCIIYCVTLGMAAPQSLRDIAVQTGGQLFENVTTIEEAEGVYRKILQIAQGGAPCAIEWTGVSCNAGNIKVLLSWSSENSSARYSAPTNLIETLEVTPTVVSFGRILPGTVKDTTIKLTAHNADFTVTNIVRTFGSAAFTVQNATFPLIISRGSERIFTLRFGPTDSAMNYGSFEIQTDRCPFSVSSSGGFSDKKMATPTLKLTNPIGGETFVVGSDTLITWKGVSPSDTVKLEYSADGGNRWETLTNAATGLQYVWRNIPRPAGTQSRIKASQKNSDPGARSQGTLIADITGHDGKVYAFAWSPDGNRVATASGDGFARIWDAHTGSLLYRLGPDSSAGVTAITWSPDGSRVATANVNSTSKIWNAKTGLLLFTLKGHTDWVTAVTWSPDGRKVATASMDSTAKVWDATTGSLLLSLTGHSSWIYGVPWSHDGNRIATASQDGSARIWNATTAVLLYTLSHNREVWDVKWSSDGNKVATTGQDSTGNIWDATTGKLLHTLKGHRGFGYVVNWNPDGSKIVTASNDGTAKIWNATNGAELNTLTGHTSAVLDVNWSPDGSRVATSSYDGTAKIWDATTGVVLSTLETTYGARSVAWSPDGSRVATLSDGRAVRIWSIDDVPMQEDASSVFSVVMPSPLSSDVDMQQCLVGSSKDSVVADGIRNTGTYPFRTDSVSFAGADASSFSLVSGIPPFDVDPGTSHPLEFRFAPKRTGPHSADIVIVTQADTLVQRIQGIGVASSLAIVNNIIDFGKVLVGASKDTLNAVTITNAGSAPLTITATRHAGPNDVDFTTLAGGNTFTLNAGDTAKVDLRFSPSARGRTSGRLLFDYNGFGSPAMVQLFAEGVGPDTARTTIVIDNINAQAGEKVNLVLKLDRQSGLQLANSPTDWFARIHYNPTILFNEQTNNVCVSVSNDSCTIELTGKYNPTSAVLASVPCVATLGTTDRATLDIETFVWTNGDVEAETQLIDGVITVTGICEDGGVRLFIPAGSSTALASRPNPVKDELRIDYGLVSETSVTLTLTSSTGQVAQTIVSNKPHSAGRYDVVQDVSSLSSGVYYLTLRTNAHTLTGRVDIVK